MSIRQFFGATLLLVCAALIQSAAAAAPGKDFTSANRQFSVELSLTPEKEVLVAVFHATNEAKALHWSRAVAWEEPDSHWGSSDPYEVKALVTNDGNTVVLRDFNTTSEKNGVKLVRRASTSDHVARPFQRRELTAMQPGNASSGAMRPGTSYRIVGSLLDFIFEEKNSYALWFGQTDQWLLISLSDFKETVVRDEDTLHALNKTAYAQAKDLVLQHQPPPMRRMLASLKNKIVDFVPSLATPSSPVIMHAGVSAAYLFLTARHASSDRYLIERLVNFLPQGIHRSYRWRERVDLQFSIGDSERIIGDFLWSRWNGDTHREFLGRELYLLLPHDTFHYLGSLTFDLQFPISVPSTNSGNLWAYLIPAAVPAGEWDRSGKALVLHGRLTPMGQPISSKHLGLDGTVTVRGLTPGDYRAKFVWERSPPAGIWRTNHYRPITGDYESAQTQTITVQAGATVSNIPVAITNLVVGATPPPTP